MTFERKYFENGDIGYRAYRDFVKETYNNVYDLYNICKGDLMVKDLEYQRKWRKENPDKVLEYNKRTNEKKRKNYDKEKNGIICKKWREKHREYCLKKGREDSRKYYREHREEHLKRTHDYMRRLRRDVFSHYSPELKCQRCGFSDMRALSIDHVKGDGAEHRKKIWGSVTTGGGNRILCWLKKNNYPEGFQVLCMNCQFIKRCENKESGCRRVE